MRKSLYGASWGEVDRILDRHEAKMKSIVQQALLIGIAIGAIGALTGVGLGMWLL